MITSGRSDKLVNFVCGRNDEAEQVTFSHGSTKTQTTLIPTLRRVDYDLILEMFVSFRRVSSLSIETTSIIA